MSFTFGSSSDSPEFEVPDGDIYVFQVTKVNAPEHRPNRFFEQFCNDYAKKEGIEYDRDGDPKGKKIESNVVLECTILQSAGGDKEWAGTMVRYYSSSKPGNELGSTEYPTKLRRLANAVLNKTMQNGETIDADDILNGYFQGTYEVTEKEDGSVRGKIVSCAPYKQQGTGQGGRRRQQTAPPPPPSVPTDEEFSDSDFDDSEMVS
jgi:hypothetical protein